MSKQTQNPGMTLDGAQSVLGQIQAARAIPGGADRAAHLRNLAAALPDRYRRHGETMCIAANLCETDALNSISSRYLEVLVERFAEFARPALVTENDPNDPLTVIPKPQNPEASRQWWARYDEGSNLSNPHRITPGMR